MPAEPALDELIPPPPPVEWQEMVGDDLVTQLIEGRRRPGYNPDLPDPLTQDNEGALRPPPPEAFQIGRATSELQSLMRISYAVFCLKKKKNQQHKPITNIST